MAKKRDPGPTGNGSQHNSHVGGPIPRAQFDADQAGTRVPYYPEFDAVDSSFSASINQRNYIPGASSEPPAANEAARFDRIRGS